MYERFQGCIRRHLARKDYCCVCAFHKHYSHRELDFIKHDGLKLQKFYFNILKDLAEIMCVDPTVVFWETEYFYYKYTQKLRTRRTSLRKNLECYFSSQVEVPFIHRADFLKCRACLISLRTESMFKLRTRRYLLRRNEKL